MTEMQASLAKARERRIDPASLSGKQYFFSLVGQGLACGLLDQADAERLQTEGLLLLADRIDRFTQGKSSSVPAEQAERLLGGAAYTIGLALKQYLSPEEALDALRQTPLSALEKAGERTLQSKLRAAQLLHRRLCGQLFSTPNVFYRATAVDGLAGFFRLYRPDAFPQELLISADYPVYSSIDDGAGMEYLERYLRCLIYENQFLRLFSPQRVDGLLRGMDVRYAQLLMNLFGPVLAAALSCVMTGQPVPALRCDRDALAALLRGKPAAEITPMLLDAARRLEAELGFTAGLRRYLHSCLPKLGRELVGALSLGRLDAIVPFPAAETAAPQLLLTYGQRMSALAYDQLLMALMRADDSTEKAALILEQVQSLGDLLEALRDGNLSARDLAALFPQLPLPVMAALKARYAEDAFLSDPQEQAVAQALRDFFSRLPKATAEQLYKISQSISFEIE